LVRFSMNGPKFFFCYIFFLQHYCTRPVATISITCFVFSTAFFLLRNIVHYLITPSLGSSRFLLRGMVRINSSPFLTFRPVTSIPWDPPVFFWLRLCLGGLDQSFCFTATNSELGLYLTSDPLLHPLSSFSIYSLIQKNLLCPLDPIPAT